MKHLLAIPLVLLSVTVPPTRHGPPDSMCSVRTLREQPGYQYTVAQIQHLVESAEVIVRAEAVDSFRVFRANPPRPKDTRDTVFSNPDIEHERGGVGGCEGVG